MVDGEGILYVEAVAVCAICLYNFRFIHSIRLYNNILSWQFTILALHVAPVVSIRCLGLSHAVEYRCAVFWALLSWGCRAFLPSIFSLAMLLVEAAAYASDLDSVLLEALFLLQLVIAFGAWSGMLLASCFSSFTFVPFDRHLNKGLRHFCASSAARRCFLHEFLSHFVVQMIFADIIRRRLGYVPNLWSAVRGAMPIQAIYAALVLTTAILIPPHGLPYNLGQIPKFLQFPATSWLPRLLVGEGAVTRVNTRFLPWWARVAADQEMSSKDACIKQTSMGKTRTGTSVTCSLLCKQGQRPAVGAGNMPGDALRSELDVDVVLFDGGNIRGNRDYVPVKGHHRGSKHLGMHRRRKNKVGVDKARARWAFTAGCQVLPWHVYISGKPWAYISGNMQLGLICIMGATDRFTIGVLLPLRPAALCLGMPWQFHAAQRADFLRVQPPVKTKSGRLGSKVAAAGDAMVQEPVTDHAVTHISGKPIVLSKRYKVALLHAALHGMNGNSVFEIWASTQGNVVPPFEACQPAAEHLTRHFTRLLWLRMPSFQILDVDKSKTISRDELLEGIPKGFPRARDPNIRRSLLRRLLATIELDSTGHITEEQYLKLHTKLKDSDSINFAEGDVFCDWAYWTSPQG
ncbi:yos-9 [Symbiodinium necroappetens]|uniref:Yos-9 protein n=1 Tax=Symbiodinium necroappetens TaxID=1628268 RepID=A0A812QT73_9DINO|nr:yos-9 [Symbiodinium necroappetens]